MLCISLLNVNAFHYWLAFCFHCAVMSVPVSLSKFDIKLCCLCVQIIIAQIFKIFGIHCVLLRSAPPIPFMQQVNRYFINIFLFFVGLENSFCFGWARILEIYWFEMILHTRNCWKCKFTLKSMNHGTFQFSLHTHNIECCANCVNIETSNYEMPHIWNEHWTENIVEREEKKRAPNRKFRLSLTLSSKVYRLSFGYCLQEFRKKVHQEFFTTSALYWEQSCSLKWKRKKI